MGKLSPEQMARIKKEREANATGGRDFFTMKDRNRAVIRLLPVDIDAGEQVGAKVVAFFINKKSFVCNNQTHSKPGVIDRTLKALEKRDDAESQELAEGLRGNRRTQYLMKIIERVEGEEPDKVKWFRAPGQIYNPILAAFEDGDNLSDKTDGCDIRITKNGSGLQTEYGVRILNPSPLSESKEVRKALLAASAEMDGADLTRADEQGALEALMDSIPKAIWREIKDEVLDGLNLDGDGGGDDEDDEKPAKKKKSDDDDEPAPKKTAAKDDDDDEPAPKKKATAADDDDEPAPKKKVVADDDDEPAPKKKAAADDDDDEHAPKKKAAKDDDDDEPAPKKKVVADDDDEPAPKKKKADDDDDEPAPKKRPYKD